ncbi:MAG: putative 4-hydroxybenzoate polyprenyltransferase, partial [Actinobacteria bacterium]|nr:putative 4-hydroxybenzoate polyprenyltransferase [Actinomycetota bacterium]
MESATVPSLPRRLANLVRLEHSLFALPYAVVGALLAADGLPPIVELLWVGVAMVAARTLAMGLNRLIDAEVDARNPRTAKREIPAGLVSKGQVVGLCVVSLAVLLLACWNLAPMTRWLWPFVVVPFLIYPYMKRFTWACHLWLGLCIGLAPVAAYVAIADALPLAAFWLLGVVGFWIAGFDIIYATMDVEHDLEEGIHSAPADFGVGRALWFARVLHLLSIVSMVGVGVWAGLSWPYWIAVAACAAEALCSRSRPGPAGSCCCGGGSAGSAHGCKPTRPEHGCG